MTLPLSERMRPKTLNDVIGQEKVVEALARQVKKYKGGDSDLPNLLFSGPAGVGKTSLFLAFASELYGKDWKQYVLVLNASDERGIDVVRGQIKDFARRSTLGEQFCMVFLDESDSLTEAAQTALRVTMEAYTRTTRFVLACNSPWQLIDPIVDRCVEYRFKPLTSPQVVEALSKAIAPTTAPPTFLLDVARLSRGSLRKAFNILQGAGDAPYPNNLNLPDINDACEGIVKAAIGGNAEEADMRLLKAIGEGGLPQEIMTGLFDVLSKMNRNSDLRALGEAEWRIAGSGCNPELQLRCFVRGLK